MSCPYPFSPPWWCLAGCWCWLLSIFVCPAQHGSVLNVIFMSHFALWKVNIEMCFSWPNSFVLWFCCCCLISGRCAHTRAHMYTHTHTHTLIHLTAYNKVWKEWGPRLAWATYFSTLNLAFSNSFFSPNNQGSFRKPLTKRLKPLRKTSNFLLYLPTSKHWKTNLHITETNPEAKLVATTFTVLFSLEVEKFSF